MAAFLHTQDLACLLWGTDQGSAFVVKLPAREIRSIRGRVPIRVRHELYEHPSAPVIRTVVTISDQPQRPLALESYTNVEDEQQRTEFAALADQARYLLLVYDERLQHRLNKVVPKRPDPTIAQIVERAVRMQAAIPPEQFDFDAAKAAVLERTRL